MRAFAWRWIVNGLGLAVAAALVPGVSIAYWPAGVLAALTLGLVNATLRPLVLILTWPIRVLTLGLFTLVINAGLLLLVAWLVPGFAVAGFVPALLAGMLLSVISTVLIAAPGRRW